MATNFDMMADGITPEQAADFMRAAIEGDEAGIVVAMSGEEEPAEAMDDNELLAILGEYERQSIGYFSDEISEEQIKAIKYYYREPFGDEQEGRSQVVDGTVQIVVDNALASILKPFVSAEDVVAFEPRNPEDVEAAEQATEYVNYILNCDNNGFQVFHDWFKDALLTKLGVVKVWWDDTSEDKIEILDNLDAMQVEMLMQSGEVVSGPYLSMDTGMELYSVGVRRSYEDGRIRIENVPPEEFLISPSARSLDSASYVAHRTVKSRSELIQLGFDRDVVENLSQGTRDDDWDTRAQVRYADESFGQAYEYTGDEANAPIIVLDEYVHVDYNGDGIAELRRIVRSGDTILLNEEVPERPFAILCPVPMPHKVYGLSVADQVLDLQRISSVLWRQMLDNLYLANNPRPHIPQGAERSDGSTIDDLMDPSPGAAVREGNLPVRYEGIPFFAEKSFPMLQYAEGQQEARTGIGRNGQGLDTNAIKKSGQMTATEMSIMEGAKNTRVEMIARIFAETGVKRLFRLILKMVVDYQPRERIIRLRNKWVPIDPRSWNAEMDVMINVGLGVGSKMEQINQANELIATMAQLAQTEYAFMVSPENVYNAIKRKFQALGVKNLDPFITEPTPENMPQPNQQQPDPAMLKAQADMQMQQAKMQLDQQKAAADIQVQREKADAQIQFERERAALQEQLARDKATAEYQLAQEKMAMEAELARQRMAMEAELAREKARLTAAMQSETTIATNRPGGDLSE